MEKHNTYVDQSADALRLCLYKGIPNLENLHIFEEYEKEISPGVRIHLGIIGASHFFSLRMEDSFSFTEILACTEPPDFEGETLHTSLLKILMDTGHSVEFPISPSFRYYLRSRVVDNIHGEAASLLKAFWRRIDATRAEKCPNVITLSHDFSSDDKIGATKRAFSPQTLLSFSMERSKRFDLNTAHAYPNEGKVVFTCSGIYEY